MLKNCSLIVLFLVSLTSVAQAQIYTAGINDNFALPVEQTFAVRELDSWIRNRGGKNIDGALDFDEITNDQYFAWSYVNLPTNIVSARLTIHIRGTIGGAFNDAILLWFNTTSETFAWSRRLDTLVRGGVWCDGCEETLILDLDNLPADGNGTTTILDQINSVRRLDVVLQDDTAVDFIELEVVPGSCPYGSRPEVVVQAPAPITCVCDSFTLSGSVTDPDGNYAGDMLEIKAFGDTDWTMINTAASPRNGALYTHDVSTLPEGVYFYRVTAEDTCMMSGSDVTAIRINRQPPSIDVRIPEEGDIVGGQVCIEGFISSTCGKSTIYAYRPLGSRDWIEFGGGAAWPATLAKWITSGLSETQYELLVSSTSNCGYTRDDIRTLTVDNTSPVAEIIQPEACEFVGDFVEIRGTASDLNLAGWSVQVTGGDYRGWHTIASGNTNIVNDVLTVWDTRDIRNCAYTIRLVVTDQARVGCSRVPHTSVDSVSVNVGDRFDVDADKDVDLLDYQAFLLSFTGP